MSTEHPWPVDPTPGEMAYVAICPTCHGVTFICATEHLMRHTTTVTSLICRGEDLYRVPVSEIVHPVWEFCRCHRKEMPHA